LVGLDISSTAVKLVELSGKGNSYRIESFAVEPLPRGTVVEKAIVNAEAVGESIRRAVKRSRTSARNAAVAVAGSAVITKVISMPASLNDDDMASQIEYEAPQYIPYSLQEVSMDFQTIGPTRKNPDMVDVVLAASRTEHVDMRVAAVEMGGLTTRIVDVEAYATENALGLIAAQLPDKGKGKLVAIFDVGATMMSFNVLDDLRTIYTREQLFGGQQLTEAIQQRYGMSYEEAGKAKRQGGLPEDYVDEVLEPYKEGMAQQITRSLQFFFSSSQYNTVDHIFLAGGNAFIPGVAALIESKTRTSTSIANPFTGMSTSSRVNAQAIANDAPALMIACGLALRNFD
jgi:type IV pilus assembly protein PilM